jgi:hypothetical protein
MGGEAASGVTWADFGQFVDTFAQGSLDYLESRCKEPFLPARFPGSSMVEHSAVNRRVASSNLARGANYFSQAKIASMERHVFEAPVAEALAIRDQ